MTDTCHAGQSKNRLCDPPAGGSHIFKTFGGVYEQRRFEGKTKEKTLKNKLTKKNNFDKLKEVKKIAPTQSLKK